MSEDEIRLRGSLSPEDLVRLQINRCNVTSSYPDREVFNANVLTLMRNLPSHKLVELKLQKKEYTTKTTVYQYKRSCGRLMGTPENPIYRNKKDDWNWDGGDPILVSPVPVDVEMTDYDKLFELVMMKLEEAGLTWKVDMAMVDGGRIEKKRTKQTPTFRSDYFLITSKKDVKEDE